MAKLTGKGEQVTMPDEDDLEHSVDISDLTANPLGSSKKAKVKTKRRGILSAKKYDAPNASDQATATPFTSYKCKITTGVSDGSLIMYEPLKGVSHLIVNESGSKKKIYPYLGTNIDALANNVPIVLADGGRVGFTCYDDGTMEKD